MYALLPSHGNGIGPFSALHENATADHRRCYSNLNVLGSPFARKITTNTLRLKIVCHGMLAPRKFMQRRKRVDVFKDEADEAEVKKWRRLMGEIAQSGSAVAVLRIQRGAKGEALPRDLVLGTLVRFKQLKRWNIVSEILEWLRCQHWWNFTEMDFLMLITAYGKLGDFNRAERILKYMNKKGYAPSVLSYTALMEAYGKSGEYSKAEAIFRRMQVLGPAPSPLTYQIILKTFVEGNKYVEAETIFQSLMNEERSPFKPDQKMFHMMIYMYKKAGNYDQARKLFSQMAEKGVPHSTVTFNCLMSFENNYKEVSNVYDQMQRAGHKPDVVSYAHLISAYGKARREDEALAVFEEMLDAGVRTVLLPRRAVSTYQTTESVSMNQIIVSTRTSDTGQDMRNGNLSENDKIPTHKAYNILLDAFAISGMVKEARTVFKSMRRDKFTPDLCSYATMLSAYVNALDMEGAEKFFRRLKEDGLKPDVIVYGTLMKGYAKENNLEKVMRVYERMQMQGIEANQVIFTTIMDAHGKNSDFESAVIWFRELIARGLPPDQKAKNVLLSLAKTPEERKEANKLAGNVSDLSDFDGDSKNGEINAGCDASKPPNGSDLCKESVSKFSDLDIDDDVESDDEELDLDSQESQELTFVKHL